MNCTLGGVRGELSPSQYLWSPLTSFLLSTFRDVVRGRLDKCFLFCEAQFGDCFSL